MKKTSAIVLLLALFSTYSNQVMDSFGQEKVNNEEMTFYEKEDSSFSVQNGNITCSNTANKIETLLYQKKASLTSTTVIEGNLTLSENGKAGFIFGVKDIDNPINNGYYSLLYSNGEFSLDSYITGSVNQGNYKYSFPLQENIKVKVELTSASCIRFYANDTLIFDVFDYEYQGGYFGYLSNSGNVTITNYNVTLIDDLQGIESIEIPELNFIYIPYLYGYDYPIKEYKEINISVQPKEGYEITINGESTCSSKINVDQDMKVSIVASKGSLSTEYLINIRKGYDDSYRPSFHKSVEFGFINDPNGLVYDKDTDLYHMFYQYTKTLNSDVNGNKNTPNDGSTGKFTRSWAHCVSRDLIYWKDMPTAILPYDGGDIFSGSCVVDTNNSSKLFTDNKPGESKLVAIYTWYGPNWHHPINISYSKDWGVTWENYGTVFDGSNDVYGDYRDPKVSWFEDDSLEAGGTWMMVFGGWTQIHLLTSPDLINWTFNSKIKGFDGQEFIGECPDLVKLKFEDSYKYVLTLAGEYYIIGDIKKINGKYEFVSLTHQNLLYNNTIIANKSWNKGCLYAGVTFNSEKYNRAIMVSWMVDYLSDYVDDKYWNGYYTVPAELKITKLNGMYVLSKSPIEEIKTLHEEKLIELKDTVIEPNGENLLKDLEVLCADIDMEFEIQTCSKLIFKITKDANSYYTLTYDCRNAVVQIDYTANGINCPWEDFNGSGSIKASLLPVNNKISLRVLLDNLAIDTFANEGIQAFYSYLWSNKKATLSLSVEGGNAKICHLTINKLGGIY